MHKSRTYLAQRPQISFNLEISYFGDRKIFAPNIQVRSPAHSCRSVPSSTEGDSQMQRYGSEVCYYNYSNSIFGLELSYSNSYRIPTIPLPTLSPLYPNPYFATVPDSGLGGRAWLLERVKEVLVIVVRREDHLVLCKINK